MLCPAGTIAGSENEPNEKPFPTTMTSDTVTAPVPSFITMAIIVSRVPTTVLGKPTELADAISSPSSC